EAKATAVELKKEDQTTAGVEPDQVGWVRIKWKEKDEPGATRTDAATILRATLWLNSQTNGPFPLFEIFVRFHEPLKLSREDLVQNLGPRSTGELPYTFRLDCWSVTRSELAITTNVLGEHDPEKDLIVVGKPVRLTADECKSLRDKYNESKIASAYRLPITIRDRPQGGAPYDAGPYRRRIELSLADDGRSSAFIEVKGSIQGE